MTTTHSPATAAGQFLLERLKPHVRKGLSPIPLMPLQPVLDRIIRHVLRQRPDLPRRLGVHRGRLFVVDPTNMPFVLLLRVDPGRPLLRAVRRHEIPPHEARMSGTFLTLMDMVDGRLDGDALFFSRDLAVTGDTEAVVCLRNALDDLEGSVIEDAASLFGPPGRALLKLLRKARELDGDQH